MSPGSLVRLPPPAGADWLACTDADLDVGVAARWVVEPGCGAVVTFTGTVRDHSDGVTDVRGLEYEAYEEHVVPALAAVAVDLRQRYPDLGRIVLWHRVGSLAVTDTAVVVAVSSPHRDHAFLAARAGIDSVKATAPIWKLEHHSGGSDWVRCDHAAQAAHDDHARRHGHGDQHQGQGSHDRTTVAPSGTPPNRVSA